jgi:hypothetical protein
LDPLIALAFPAVFAAGVVSLILRFRRSIGVERQQIKWVVFGLVVALVGVVSTSFSSEDTPLNALVGGAAFLMFPLSVGSPCPLPPYDLDVVVRRR